MKNNFVVKKFKEDYKFGNKKIYSNLSDSHGPLRTVKSEPLKLGFEREVFDSEKSEIPIEHIIEMSTNQGELIVDYHLGSGTTAAVAHKMGRQYIGIEQMSHIRSFAFERLEKVIDGEQGMVSSAVGWREGRYFIYCELAKLNALYLENIDAAQSSEDLQIV